MELDLGIIKKSRRRTLAETAWSWRDNSCSPNDRICPVSVAESVEFARLVPGFEFTFGDHAFHAKTVDCKGFVKHWWSSGGERVRTMLAIRERFYNAAFERAKNPIASAKAAFLTAHELKHVIVDKDEVKGDLLFDASSLKRRLREAEANYFAMCYLLSHSAFSKRLTIKAIAERYGTSEAMVELFWDNRPY